MPLRLVLVEDPQALREGLALLDRAGREVVGSAGSLADGEEATTRVHAVALALREGYRSPPGRD